MRAQFFGCHCEASKKPRQSQGSWMRTMPVGLDNRFPEIATSVALLPPRNDTTDGASVGDGVLDVPVCGANEPSEMVQRRHCQFTSQSALRLTAPLKGSLEYKSVAKRHLNYSLFIIHYSTTNKDCALGERDKSLFVEPSPFTKKCTCSYKCIFSWFN